MNERQKLLHNMSSPPKSVVKYTGLSGLAECKIGGGSGVTSIKYLGGSQFGQALRFCLPENLRGLSPEKLLASLDGVVPVGERATCERRLSVLINRRAAELPLPDGCAVIKSDPAHEMLWDDALSALAILSKSTETVWLRSKSPALSLALQRSSVSLLIPSGFADLLKGARK